MVSSVGRRISWGLVETRNPAASVHILDRGFEGYVR